MLEIARVVQCLYNQLASGALSGPTPVGPESLGTNTYLASFPLVTLPALGTSTILSTTWTNPSATRSAAVFINAKSNLIGQVNNLIPTIYNSDVSTLLRTSGSTLGPNVQLGGSTRLLNAGSTPGNSAAPLYVYTSHATNSGTVIVPPSGVLTVEYRLYVNSAAVNMNVLELLEPFVNIIGHLI